MHAWLLLHLVMLEGVCVCVCVDAMGRLDWFVRMVYDCGAAMLQ